MLMDIITTIDTRSSYRKKEVRNNLRRAFGMVLRASPWQSCLADIEPLTCFFLGHVRPQQRYYC